MCHLHSVSCYAEIRRIYNEAAKKVVMEVFMVGPCDKGHGPGPGPGQGPGHRHGPDHGHGPGQGHCGPGGPFGFGPFMRNRFFGGAFDEHMLRELDLSDEQVEQLGDLKMVQQGKLGQFKGTMGEIMRLIGKELAQPTIDKEKIAGLRQQLKAKKSEMEDIFLDGMVSLAEVLTPEQRKRLHMAATRRFLGLPPEQNP